MKKIMKMAAVLLALVVFTPTVCIAEDAITTDDSASDTGVYLDKLKKINTQQISYVRTHEYSDLLSGQIAGYEESSGLSAEKYGVLNRSGELLFSIGMEEDSNYEFLPLGDNRVFVKKQYFRPGFEYEEEIALLDDTGRELTGYQYHGLLLDPENPAFPVIMQTAPEENLKCTFEEYRNLDVSCTYSLLDESGRELLAGFSSLTFGDGFIIGEKDGAKAIYSKSGEIVQSLEANQSIVHYGNFWFLYTAGTNTDYQLLDAQGRKVSDKAFDRVYGGYESSFLVQEGGSIMLYDEACNIIREMKNIEVVTEQALPTGTVYKLDPEQEHRAIVLKSENETFAMDGKGKNIFKTSKENILVLDDTSSVSSVAVSCILAYSDDWKKQTVYSLDGITFYSTEDAPENTMYLLINGIAFMADINGFLKHVPASDLLEGSPDPYSFVTVIDENAFIGKRIDGIFQYTSITDSGIERKELPYSDVSVFVNGTACVQTFPTAFEDDSIAPNTDPSMIIESLHSAQYGIIDEKGNEVVPCKYETILLNRGKSLADYYTLMNGSYEAKTWINMDERHEFYLTDTRRIEYKPLAYQSENSSSLLQDIINENERESFDKVLNPVIFDRFIIASASATYNIFGVDKNRTVTFEKEMNSNFVLIDKDLAYYEGSLLKMATAMERPEITPEQFKKARQKGPLNWPLLCICLIGAGILCTCAVITGSKLLKKRKALHTAVEVQTEPETADTPETIEDISAVYNRIAQKLSGLNQMKTKAIIDEAEFEQLRASLLDTVNKEQAPTDAKEETEWPS